MYIVCVCACVCSCTTTLHGGPNGLHVSARTFVQGTYKRTYCRGVRIRVSTSFFFPLSHSCSTYYFFPCFFLGARKKAIEGMESRIKKKGDR